MGLSIKIVKLVWLEAAEFAVEQLYLLPKYSTSPHKLTRINPSVVNS